MELRADHGIVLAAVLENEESLQHASEEIRKRNRLIALFAERHPGEIRVRCFGLSADEIVVHFELDAAAEVLVPRVKDALPRGLGRITLVLLDGTILQPQPESAEELREGNRLVQLLAEPHPGEFRVRCSGDC